MKRRLISMALAVIMCLSLFPVTAFAAEKPSPFKFEIEEQEYYRFAIVTGTYGPQSGELEVPAEYQGLPVRKIADNAFRDMPKLTSVIMPDEVDYIGDDVFNGCTSLKKVRLPRALDHVGSNAFKGTPWYEDRPDGIAYEQGYLIRAKGSEPLGQVSVPRGISRILPNAFSNGNNNTLTSIELPDTMIGIMDHAFDGCQNLTTVDGMEYVQRIGSNAFSYCSKLSTLNFGDKLSGIGDAAFRQCNALTKITLPQHLKRINNNAFRECANLTEVATTGSELTDVGYGAFKGCTKLSKIELPYSVQHVGGGALSGTAWEKAQPTGLLKNNGVLLGYHGNMPGNYRLNIDSGVIADDAFSNSSNLVSVSINGSSYDTGMHAFAGCRNLTSVIVGKKVKSIADGCFADCSALTSVHMEFGLVNISDFAFARCSSLQTVKIPNTVESLGEGAFSECTSLRSANLDYVDVIGDMAFADCPALVDVKILKYVRSIGDQAFIYCTGLENIELGGSLTEIGQDAFNHCTALQTVKFNGTGPKIGDRAFWDTGAKLYYPADDPNWEPTFYDHATDSGNRWDRIRSDDMLASPEGLQLRFKDNTVTVSWNATQDASKYKVWRADSNDQTFKCIGETTQTSFNDTTIDQPGLTYYYHIQAVDANGKGGAVFGAVEYVAHLYLKTPTSSYTDEGKPCIRWEPVPNVTEFEVYAEDLAGNRTPVGEGRVDKEGWYVVHESAQTGDIFNYYVLATVGDRTYSSRAVMVVCLLPRPTIQATLNEDGKPVISWKSLPGVEKYEVEYAKDGGDFTFWKFTSECSITHSDAEYGSTYAYRVRSKFHSSSGNSEWSNTVTATVTPPQMAAPVLKGQAYEEDRHISLSWNAVKGAVRYEVQESQNGTYVSVGTTSQTTMNRYNVSGGQHTYRVRALGPAESSSAWSNTITLSMSAQGLTAPVLETTYDENSGQVQLNWSTVAGATNYEVQHASNDGEFQTLKTTGNTTMTISDLAEGEYAYRVRALNKETGDSSAWSNISIINVSSNRLDKPFLDGSYSKRLKQVKLRWDFVVDAVGYELQCSTGGAFETLETTTDVKMTIKNVSNGEYRYRVRALSAEPGGNSEWSNVLVIDTGGMKAPVLEASFDKSAGQVNLSWNAIEGALEYEVQYSRGGEFNSLGATAETTMTHSGVTDGEYSYRVRALSAEAGASGAWSAPVSITVKLASSQLSAPVVKIRIDEGSGRPSLSWNAIEGAKEYQIWRREGKDGAWRNLYTTTKTSYTNTTAEPGKTYYYQVRAMDQADKKGLLSPVKYITCDCARPGVEATLRDGLPYLTWQSIKGAKGYEIWRSTNSGDYVKMYTTTKTTYTNTSAKPGNTYTYKIRALCAITSYGDGAFSYPDKVEVPMQQLSAPNAKLSIKSDSGKPYLSWNAIDGAKEYQIWRRVDKDGAWKLQWTTTNTYYTNTSAEPGVTYYYQVRAMDKDGNKGKLTPVKYITCDCARPNVDATTRNGQPYLTWQAVDGAKSYEIWRSTNGGEFYRQYTTTRTSYTNTSAKKGNTYTYKVKALCGKSSYGDSAFSYVDTVNMK